MYIWNTGALITELASETVRESEKMKYLLVGSVIYLTTGYFTVLPSSEWNTIYFTEFVIALGITLFGVIRSYQNNGGSDGKYFLERFTCLSVPISIKCLIIFWPPFFVFYRFTDPKDLGIPQSSAIHVLELVVFVTALGFSALYYYLMTTSFVKLKASNIHLTTGSTGRRR